jgi:hypothetical protein
MRTVTVLGKFIYLFFAVWGFELRIYTLNHSVSPFLWWVFQDRVLRTICPGWLWTVILLISPSWIAKITGGKIFNRYFRYLEIWILCKLHDFPIMWDEMPHNVGVNQPSCKLHEVILLFLRSEDSKNEAKQTFWWKDKIKFFFNSFT